MIHKNTDTDIIYMCVCIYDWNKNVIKMEIKLIMKVYIFYFSLNCPLVDFYFFQNIMDFMNIEKFRIN